MTGGFAASMQPVLVAIGFDASLRLVSMLGGTRVRILADPPPRDPLAAAIGLDALQQLCQALGEGPLDVPRCETWLINRRNGEICARYLGGESQAELAVRFSLTERHIRRVVADCERTTKEESKT